MRPDRRRRRLTIAGLMALVVVAAVLVNEFRPLSRSEAIGVAEARFRKIPGSARWVGRYRVRAWWSGDLWFVNFTEPENGNVLAQIPVTPAGKARWVALDSPSFREPGPGP